jgi:hypothetical protein
VLSVLVKCIHQNGIGRVSGALLLSSHWCWFDEYITQFRHWMVAALFTLIEMITGRKPKISLLSMRKWRE